jgi:hypothetical protein
MHIQWILRALGALVTLVGSGNSQARDIHDVAQQFLHRHGVPCLTVVRVDSTHELGEVATCQDGREWVLFWLEDEIAFVDPESRQPYRWQRDVYVSYPGLYALSKPGTRDRTSRGEASSAALK